MSNKEVYVTSNGLEEMKNELDHLINVRRPEVINALKEARALGDLSENAEYDAARNDQAVVENRIKELEVLIENAKVIDDVSTDKVTIGTTYQINEIYDTDNNLIDIVRHPKQIVYLKVDFPLNINDMMRIKI